MILQSARKVVVLVIGGTVLLFGVVALITPALPGALAIPAGLAILATEFVWARRLLKKMRDQTAKLTARTDCPRAGVNAMTHCLQSAAALLGRLLLCAIFFESAYGKVTGWERTRQAMEARGMPAAQIGVPVAVVAEAAGAVLLLLGFRARLGAVLLLAFLVPATLYFHNFWTYPAEQVRVQEINFTKNLAIMGGLLTVAAHGPGGWSLDAWRKRKIEDRESRRDEATPPLSDSE